MRPTSFALLAAVLYLAPPTIAHASGDGSHRGPYSVELVDEGGNVLPTYQERGRTYVLGKLGRRYLVRVRNGSARRVEVVVSVDGRDVLDGRPSGWGRGGYVVDAHGELLVDGYRLSRESVAAFRFGSVARSYASRMGDARDVGVIGVAVFPEREPPRSRPWWRSRPGARTDEEGFAPDAGASSDRSDDEGFERDAAAPPDVAPSAPGEARAEARGDLPGRSRAPRPGLGTEFGEERESRVVEVAFVRARSRPDALLELRYDDRAGLVALGIDVDRRRAPRADDRWLRETADPFRRGAFAEPPPGWRR